ncbi:hypothetical protein [Tabrizicola sp.]|uniref:hypothetical protein n=1 Tax=Tabrizicola sp. TaxID=2005166 RepID=UPI0035B4BD8A
MVWAGIFAIALFFIAALAMPTKRAKEIESAKGALPRGVTNRDMAYVVQLAKLFGKREFSLRSIEGKHISRQIMDRFDVKSGRLDDRTVLGVRLPEMGLLSIVKPGRYRLTQAAIDLTEETQGESLN